MSGSLVRKIGSLPSANYGINIFEQAQAPAVRGKSTRKIGVVADLPWGPVNTLTDITSVGQLLEAFCPNVFAGASGTYQAMRAFLNKPFPGGLTICRIAATSAATAVFDFQDNDPENSVRVSARYPGALGNRIRVAWSVNADDATARDATVTITGSTYSAFYENVATMAPGLTVTDPGDPYCVFAISPSGTPDEVPAAIAATSLASGADGTAVAGDYVGSGSSSVGIRKFYAESAKVAALFVAECPSGLIDDVNDGLELYATEADKGMTILCTVASQTVANAITYVDDYHDDRLVYAWPKVKTTNFFDSATPEITVDGNAFVASAIASCDPWISPGASGGAEFIRGITALEQDVATPTDLDNLNAAGVAPFMIEDTLGPIIRKAVTTSITDGLTKIRRRRTADYLVDSIGAFLVNYVETPNDLDLDNQALGPNTGAEIGAIKAFLDGEVSAFHIASASVDPYGGNTELAMDAGTFTILVAAETFADQDNIILSANIGDGVATVAA